MTDLYSLVDTIYQVAGELPPAINWTPFSLGSDLEDAPSIVSPLFGFIVTAKSVPVFLMYRIIPFTALGGLQVIAFKLSLSSLRFIPKRISLFRTVCG